MVTFGDAILAALTANWTGAGGVEPEPFSTENTRTWPSSNDYFLMYTGTFDRQLLKRINDTYVSERHIITMRIHSKNDATFEDRLDIIVNECRRILTPTNVTGYHMIDVVRESRIDSDWKKGIYVANLTIQGDIYITDSAVTPGSTTSADFTMDTLTVTTSADITGLTTPDDVAIGGNLAVSGTGTSPFAGLVRVGVNTDTTDPIELFKFNTERAWSFRKRDTGASTTLALESDTAGKEFWVGYDDGVIYCAKFKVVDTQTSCTVRLAHDVTVDGDLILGTGTASVSEALMLGTANAAWVPCVFYGTNLGTQPKIVSSFVEPSDTTNKNYFYILPKPTNKGTLKLYIQDIKIGLFDADGSNYITYYKISGVDYNSDATLQSNIADLTTQDAHTDPFTPVDCSAYEHISLYLEAVIGTAANLDIASVSIHCYYA